MLERLVAASERYSENMQGITPLKISPGYNNRKFIPGRSISEKVLDFVCVVLSGIVLFFVFFFGSFFVLIFIPACCCFFLGTFIL